MVVRILWGYDYRRHRSAYLGCCGYLFFHENGMEETNAAVIVDAITKNWLGAVGGVLAVLGVIAAPITSGDTAFRSARLIVADFLGMEQSPFAVVYIYVCRCFWLLSDCCCTACATKTVLT